MTSTAIWTAAGWILASLTVGNIFACWANLRRADDLDEYAEVLLRDRARVLDIAKSLREREQSLEQGRKDLEVFVALNPITRLQHRTEA
jgi:hypothetical protein